MRFPRAMASALFLAALGAGLAGCADGVPPDYHDPTVDQGREDFRGLSEPPAGDDPGPPAASAAGGGPLPLAPVMVRPEPPALTNNPPVSVSVTESVPLKTVLFELSREAGVDVEIDPRITGGIVFSARQRPYLDVIDRIAALSGLRYRARDDVVRIELDEPYLETYSLPYLSQSRTTRSEIEISTEIGSDNDTGSSSSVTGEATADFYPLVEQALTSVVASTRAPGLPDPPGGAAEVTVNPQAGIVTVFGTDRQHAAVSDLLSELSASAGAQVLIEAKVVEVGLEERYRSGVNWSAVFEGLDVAVTGDFSFADDATNPLSVAVDTTELDAIVEAVAEFGTVRTLSSPRVTVLNNQTAILKVADNEVFFEVDVEFERDNDGNVVDRTVSSTIRTVPVGLVMTVQPAIDRGRDSITLTVRPTITEISRFVSDPAVEIESGNTVESRIPVVEVREVDSVLRLRSGTVAVLGGLMEERAINEDEGVPGLSRIPWAGRLFKTRDEQASLTELVVFLRATVAEAPPIGPADRRLYETFARDPRPLTF
ncbi:MAG: type II and III secretion system protein [Azospirillaceae bacterium]